MFLFLKLLKKQTKDPVLYIVQVQGTQPDFAKND